MQHRLAHRGPDEGDAAPAALLRRDARGADRRARTTWSTSARARSAAAQAQHRALVARVRLRRGVAGRECRDAGGADRRRAGPLALAHAAPGLEGRARLGAARHLDLRRVARRGRAGRSARAARGRGRGLGADRRAAADGRRDPQARPHPRRRPVRRALRRARVRAAALLAGRHPGDRPRADRARRASCPAGSSRSTTGAAATRRRSGCRSSARSSSPTR